jgi:hypothetical protein
MFAQVIPFLEGGNILHLVCCKILPLVLTTTFNFSFELFVVCGIMIKEL